MRVGKTPLQSANTWVRAGRPGTAVRTDEHFHSLQRDMLTLDAGKTPMAFAVGSLINWAAS